MVDGMDWNARRGAGWVDLQPLLDSLFSPFDDILTAASITGDVRDILDIGCGTGATTLAFATRLAARGRCTGVDISEPMLAVARSRAAAAGIDNVDFVQADAQRFGFRRHAFDAVTSRFGIMFFDDPVRAFGNIRRSVRPGGTLHCVVWRGGSDNPFMIAAERAVAPIVRWPVPFAPDAPGQFAFADRVRVEQILRAAGWESVGFRPIEVSCSMTGDDLARYTRRMGRVGMILPDLDRAARDRIDRALDDAFAPYLVGDVARFDAACWLISARAGGADRLAAL